MINTHNYCVSITMFSCSVADEEFYCYSSTEPPRSDSRHYQDHSRRQGDVQIKAPSDNGESSWKLSVVGAWFGSNRFAFSCSFKMLTKQI